MHIGKEGLPLNYSMGINSSKERRATFIILMEIVRPRREDIIHFYAKHFYCTMLIFSTVLKWLIIYHTEFREQFEIENNFIGNV